MSVGAKAMRFKGAWALMLWPQGACAHASEQGFVLLLPTGAYVAAGTASVAVTVVLLALLPAGLVPRLFAPRRLGTAHARRGRVWRHGPSWAMAALIAALIWAGLAGPRDPLANPLPLAVWTLWWVGLVAVQGLFGDVWRRVNPLTGPSAALRALLGLRPLRLSGRMGHWIALAGFLAFAGFLLADIAPADPGRLALAAAVYWLAMLGGATLFGPRWIARADAAGTLMRAHARMALWSRGRIGLWGWRAFAMPAPPLGLAVLMLVLLGTGSFDGLNETFWWLARLGINPLEFPGRSAVQGANLAGLVAGNLGLIAAYALCLKAGLLLSGAPMTLTHAFCRFAPSILPIALGYHIAHYLPSFLVDAQYARIAATDPLARGWDLLRLGEVYVTTGFFNTKASVQAIWLGQAGAVVLGHILAILLAHGIALRSFGHTSRAVLSQVPLALFMVGYTLFGLWLLASPRGL